MRLLITLVILGLPASQRVDNLSVGQIDERVEAWQASAKERAFERIGWAQDIRAALRLSGLHKRPIFLFTHDGRLGTGRC